MVGSAAEVDVSPPAGADHVLLRAPRMATHRDEVRRAALSGHPPDATVVAVTFHQLSAERLRTFCPSGPSPETTVEAVRVRPDEPGDATLEAFASSPVEVETETVAPSESFTELGTTIRERLTAADGDVVLCLDSITALVLYGGETRTEKFLHSVRAAVDDVDGAGYYHLDHVAHDDRLVNRLEGQFDAVLEADAATTRP